MLLCSSCGSGVSPEEKFRVGNIVTFGTYPQTADGEKAPIEWIVLEREGNRALLISNRALDTRPYHDEDADVTWETCSLRKWLNEDFLNQAFTKKQRSAILTTRVKPDLDVNKGIDAGAETQDKVFILSGSEAFLYFDSYAARECRPTSYAIENGAMASTDRDTMGNVMWWVRTPGWWQNHAAFVRYDGTVLSGGFEVNQDFRTIRPVIWVDITKGGF